MIIRQANHGDARLLAPLVFCSAPAALGATLDVNNQLSAINFLDASLSTVNGQYGYENHWVCEIDSRVVGCVSAWHRELPASFHQATLTQLTGFYGITHALSVVQASLVLQDCMPKPNENECCIGHFAVHLKYQRQGIGTALLDVMHQHALNLGHCALTLDVDSTNTQAIDFYLGHGFVNNSESGVSPRMQALGIGSHFHLRKQLV